MPDPHGIIPERDWLAMTERERQQWVTMVGSVKHDSLDVIQALERLLKSDKKKK